MRRPFGFEQFPDALKCGYGPYQALVLHVVDGDTFYAVVDKGWNDYRVASVRFLHINAPELRGPERVLGLGAKRQMEHYLPVGSGVRLHTRPDPDSFGRYLCEVWAVGPDDQPFDVGEAMLTLDFAEPFEG